MYFTKLATVVVSIRHIAVLVRHIAVSIRRVFHWIGDYCLSIRHVTWLTTIAVSIRHVTRLYLSAMLPDHIYPSCHQTDDYRRIDPSVMLLD